MADWVLAAIAYFAVASTTSWTRNAARTGPKEFADFAVPLTELHDISVGLLGSAASAGRGGPVRTARHARGRGAPPSQQAARPAWRGSAVWRTAALAAESDCLVVAARRPAATAAPSPAPCWSACRGAVVVNVSRGGLVDETPC